MYPVRFEQLDDVLHEIISISERKLLLGKYLASALSMIKEQMILITIRLDLFVVSRLNYE